MSLIKRQIRVSLENLYGGAEGARGALGVKKVWQLRLEAVCYKCHIQVGFAALHPSQHPSLSGKSPTWRMVSTSSCNTSTSCVHVLD